MNGSYHKVLDVLRQQNSYVLDFNLLYTRLSLLMKEKRTHEVWKNEKYLILFWFLLTTWQN